jgi:hypothetical protein
VGTKSEEASDGGAVDGWMQVGYEIAPGLLIDGQIPKGDKATGYGVSVSPLID